MQRIVVVRLDLGEPIVGTWCDHCALPSAVTFPVLRLDSTGVTEMTRVQGCTECGEITNASR